MRGATNTTNKSQADKITNFKEFQSRNHELKFSNLIVKPSPGPFSIFFSSKSDYRRANVHLSVSESPKPLSLYVYLYVYMSICHYAYILISKMVSLISKISNFTDLWSHRSLIYRSLISQISDLTDLWSIGSLINEISHPYISVL